MQRISLIIRLKALVELSAFYVVQVVLSNLRVAVDILIPSDHIKPGVFQIHVSDYSVAEVVLTANLISMTPGTLALDYDETAGVLSIHSLYMSDPAEMEANIKSQWLSRVGRVFGNPLSTQHHPES